MFDTNLPSGRRKLFFFILLVFTIAGFGTKYLLFKFGWVGGQTKTPEAPPSALEAGPADRQNEQEPAALTTEDVEKARQAAEMFIRSYTTRDDQTKNERLQALKPLTTPSFYQILQEEAELSRPTGETHSTSFQSLGKVDCGAVGKSVECLVETILQEMQGDQPAIPVERVYQLTLVEESSDWLVEEVVLRGSID
ncbi:hypothetical protein [Lihuaxuella thermophila]|uniref:Conjugative transposon protein TcpC n=1 Tax=Lihuaxuella thermophila TaxID=1173111 RepID=A0A1H8HGM3_9BACL|nr:hypothetical protein [Lihuaxuella thermophila]SEN55353.1 hypothetical protein SAMN05444955_11425 [Lihuaxuella thermophila]